MRMMKKCVCVWGATRSTHRCPIHSHPDRMHGHRSTSPYTSTRPPDTLLYLLKKTRKAASRVQNWSTDLMVTFSFSMVVCSIAMLVK